MSHPIRPQPVQRISYYSLAATFVFFMAIMGTRPLVPLHAHELGMGLGEIGLLTAVFSLLSLIGAASAGTWMDYRGAKFILTAGIVLTALGLALPWLFSTRIGLYASQLIAGTGFTLFTIASQRLASNVGLTREAQQRSINAFSFAVSFGSFAGPSVMGVVGEKIGLSEAMLLMILPLGLCFILAHRQADTPRRMVGEDRSGIWSNPLDSLSFHPFMFRAFLISTFVLLARDSFMAFFPHYAQSHGISTAMIGVIVGLHNLGSLTARGALIPCTKLFGQNRTVLGSILLAGLFCLLLAQSHSLTMIVIAAFGIGIGLGVGQPLSIALTSRLAPNGRIGEVLGARLTFNRLTQVVAPLGFGFASMHIGVTGVFWMTGAAMILGLPALHIPDHITEDSDPPPR